MKASPTTSVVPTQGGGMRGCVAAGMASCLHFLGLADSFDSVYGASAGSLVGERIVQLVGVRRFLWAINVHVRVLAAREVV